MEPISRRRSFSKSKLVMSIYKAAKPSAAAVQPYSSKPPKPIPSINPSPTSLEFVANQPVKQRSAPPPPLPVAAESATVGFIIVNQDQVFPQQTPKVAFVYPDKKRDSYEKLENYYEDEAVDAKAASYISSVRERFRQNFEDNNIHV